MDIHKVDWNAIEWKQIRKGVEQKAFSGSGATVALHRLVPGHEPGRTAIRTNRSPISSRAECGFILGKRPTTSDRAGYSSFLRTLPIGARC
jgi:hypothetical protein